MPRLFFAVELDTQLLSRALEVQAVLMKAAGRDGVRWATREQLHVTLKFLGDVDAQQVDQVVDLGRRAVKGCAPFELGLRDVGGFPDMRRPRVGWIGVNEPSGCLAELARRIEAQFVEAGFRAEERAYRAHLTIARTKTAQGGAALGRALGEYGVRFKELGKMTAGEMVLMESELFPSGAKYTRRASFPFAQP